MKTYVVKISDDGWTDPVVVKVQARDAGHAVRVSLPVLHFELAPCPGPSVFTPGRAGRSTIWHKITITVSPALAAGQEVLGLEIQDEEEGS